MGVGDSSNGSTKRRRNHTQKSHSSSLSYGAVPPTFIHPPERSRTLTPPPNSKSVSINIDDLPDNVLVDILSRLSRRSDDGYEIWSVCRRWRHLMSGSYFRGLYLLRNKQTPPLLSLVNKTGETFPMKLTYSDSSPKFLSGLFKKIMRVMSLTCEPVVVGTSNDLILCCATESYQRDYYICNPYIRKCVNLPPPSVVMKDVPVEFQCDPYYSYIKKDKDSVHRRREKSLIIDDGNEEVVKINDWYRCRVVRILPYDDTLLEEPFSKFKLEIFSYETCEWRESVISFPRRFSFDRINLDIYFSHNEMLYWSSTWGSSNFLIGLDPFMINETDNNNINSKPSEDHDNPYEGRYIKLIGNNPDDDPLYNPDDEHKYQIHCLGSVRSGSGGCLQMCVLDSFDNTILFWELKEDKDLIIARDGAGILCSKGEGMWLNMAEEVELICFDPNDEGFLYVRLDGVDGVDGACCFKINVRTRKMDIVGKSVLNNNCFFPITVNPLWPTPVP